MTRNKLLNHDHKVGIFKTRDERQLILSAYYPFCYKDLNRGPVM